MNVDDLMKMFNVSNDSDLGAIFKRSNKAVSAWRARGVPAAIEKLAYEIKSKDKNLHPVELTDFTLIPYYNVQASAGGGAVVQEEKIVDRFAFKEDWIRHGLGLNPNNLALISTIGDSMEPTLHPGDMILLDRSVEKIQSNSIYAIQVNGTLLVKRIQKRIDGSVIIKSDNAAYETETINSDAADALKIVGRVVWAGRRF